MVSVAPRRLCEDAKALYQKSEIPASLSFFERLSPLNQRQFSRDLWPVLTRAAMEPTEANIADLVEFIDGWSATADLDADDEAAEELRRPVAYHPFRVA